MNRCKKLLSWLLIACLCIGVIPTYVLNTKAAEGTEETQTTASVGETLDAMVEKGWQVVTPETFGIQDATETTDDAGKVTLVTAATADAENISINKLLFSANMKFTSTKNNQLYYFSTGAGRIQLWMSTSYSYLMLSNALWSGTKMYVSKDGKTADETYTSGDGNGNYKLYADKAGVGAFKNNDILYWITTEFVNSPIDTDDGNPDDLKIGIWINGVLYDNQYFYVPDCSSNTYKGYVQVSNVSAIASPFVPKTTTPEGYRVVTPLTFGMSDSVAAESAKASVGETISIDKLLFSANVTYNGSANSNFYYLRGKSAGNSTTFQLNFRTSGNYIYFYNYINYNTTSGTRTMYIGDDGIDSTSDTYYSLGKAGADVTTFKDNELQIWLTTEFVKAPWLGDDEAADDLKIGVWFNGKLYNNEYFYVLDCKDLVYREYVERGSSFASSSPIMELDHMGMVGGEYAFKTVEFTTSDLVANKVMDGTTFQSSVRFEGEGGTLYYGSNDVDKAVQLTSTSDGIQVSRGNENIVLLNKNKVGIDVLNNNFDLKLTTEVVNCDDDTLTDDVKLGIYVDNKYRSFNLVNAADAADALTATIGVKTENGATVLFGDFNDDDPVQGYYCVESGGYTSVNVADVTRISVNGLSQKGNFMLDTEGTYSVAVTKDGKVDMEDVVVYQSYDIKDDEVVDVRDLVRMLKVQNEETHAKTIAELNIYEKRAIRYIDEENWTRGFGEQVLDCMKNKLLGLDVLPIDQVQIDQVQ